MASISTEKVQKSSSAAVIESQESLEAARIRQAYQLAIRKRIQEIGIKEQDYYYIAERSLKQGGLPANWVEATTDDGYIYFFNTSTEESVWSHPLLPQFKEQYERAKLMDSRHRTTRDEAEENVASSSNPPLTSRTPDRAWKSNSDDRKMQRSRDSGGSGSRDRGRRRDRGQYTPSRSRSNSDDSKGSYSGSSRSQSRSGSFSRSYSPGPSQSELEDSRQSELGESKDSNVSIARVAAEEPFRGMAKGISVCANREAQTMPLTAREKPVPENKHVHASHSFEPPLTARGPGTSSSAAPAAQVIVPASPKSPLPEQAGVTQVARIALETKVAQPITARSDSLGKENQYTAINEASEVKRVNDSEVGQPLTPVKEIPYPDNTQTMSKESEDNSFAAHNHEHHDNVISEKTQSRPMEAHSEMSSTSTSSAAVAISSYETAISQANKSPTHKQVNVEVAVAPVAGRLSVGRNGQSIPVDAVLAAGAGAELVGLPATDYWHKKYENAQRELTRVNYAMENIETQLAVYVERESQMIAEKQCVLQQTKKCSQNLQAAIKKAHAFLTFRGVEAPVSSSDQAILNNPDGGIAALSNEACTFLSAFSDEQVFAKRDERGYQRSWEGVSLRLKDEMQACFPSVALDKQTPEERERLLNDLRFRLDALAGIIVAFGEYLPSSQRSYMRLLLKHIRQQAPGNTLVPLETVLQTLNESGMSSNIVRFADGEHPLERAPGDVYAPMLERLALEPPSSMASMRAQLDTLKADKISLYEKLAEEKRAVEVITAKYVSSQRQVEDSSFREEALLNKFTELSSNLEALRMQQEPSAQIAIGMAVPVKDVNGLLDRLGSMTSEIHSVERRAADAERRCEVLLTECNHLRNTQLPALKLKSERKKMKIRDIGAKMVEMESVSRGYYSELQASLSANARYESECSDLRVRISRLEKERDMRDSGATLVTASQHSTTIATALMREQLDDAGVRIAKERSAHNETKLLLEAEMAKVYKLRSINEAMNMQGEVKSSEIKKLSHQLRETRARIAELDFARSALRSSEVGLRALSVSLNDQVCDLQGKIRVMCRVRGVISIEGEGKIDGDDFEDLCHFPDSHTLDWDNTTFEFDHVFAPSASQEKVFQELLPSVRSLLTGERLCVLSYGPTGAGKTHTLMGNLDDEEQWGIGMRALHTVFALALLDHMDVSTVVRISIVDVYNDKVKDLIPFGASNKAVPEDQADLDVRAGSDGVFLEGLTLWPVGSMAEALATISSSIRNRKNLAHLYDQRADVHSSRSHQVMFVHVERTIHTTRSTSRGLLTMVDLAGCGRLKTQDSNSRLLREGQNINKSLSAVAEVMIALGSGAKHVPHRNNRLTFLLQESMQREARIVMFINLPPPPRNIEEGRTILEYGQRCMDAADETISLSRHSVYDRKSKSKVTGK